MAERMDAPRAIRRKGELSLLYCRALLFVIWEELEVEAHQAGKFRFERTGQIIKAVV
ncbi:MAG: hypothetical protein ACI8T1_004804, partial [Verrucomicrobiales bacterium]